MTLFGLGRSHIVENGVPMRIVSSEVKIIFFLDRPRPQELDILGRFSITFYHESILAHDQLLARWIVFHSANTIKQSV